MNSKVRSETQTVFIIIIVLAIIRFIVVIFSGGQPFSDGAEFYTFAKEIKENGNIFYSLRRPILFPLITAIISKTIHINLLLANNILSSLIICFTSIILYYSSNKFNISLKRKILLVIFPFLNFELISFTWGFLSEAYSLLFFTLIFFLMINYNIEKLRGKILLFILIILQSFNHGTGLILGIFIIFFIINKQQKADIKFNKYLLAFILVFIFVLPNFVYSYYKSKHSGNIIYSMSTASIGLLGGNISLTGEWDEEHPIVKLNSNYEKLKMKSVLNEIIKFAKSEPHKFFLNFPLKLLKAFSPKSYSQCILHSNYHKYVLYIFIMQWIINFVICIGLICIPFSDNVMLRKTLIYFLFYFITLTIIFFAHPRYRLPLISISGISLISQNYKRLFKNKVFRISALVFSTNYFILSYFLIKNRLMEFIISF